MWHLPNKLFKKLATRSLELFIVTLPFQWSLLIYQSPWGKGFLNPYTSISISVAEFFLWTSSLFFLCAEWKHRWKRGDKTLLAIGLLAIATAAASLFLSPSSDPTFHALLFSKAVETVLLYMLIVNGVLKENKLLKCFIGIMSLEALLGIFQVLSQRSLGLGFLGEPHLSETTAHLAKIAWDSFTWIRAYGTFPHPNILGGFLVISILSTFLYVPTKKHERELLLLIQFLGLIATCSRSALLALACSLIFLSLRYLKNIREKSTKIVVLFISIFSLELLALFWSRGTFPWNDPAIISRWTGYKEALKLFWQYPWGVGWNHYTLYLDQFTPTPLMPWDYQPVHNIYLLILSETGLLGFLFALTAIGLFFKKMHMLHKKLSTPALKFRQRIFFLMGLSILLISAFDHYWITLEQGRLLLVLVWAIFSSFLADPLHVFPVRKGVSPWQKKGSLE